MELTYQKLDVLAVDEDDTKRYRADWGSIMINYNGLDNVLYEATHFDIRAPAEHILDN